MFWQKSAIQGGAVGLLQVAAGRQRRATVKDPDVVQPQEAALEDVVAGAVFAVHPPGEVEQQLLEGALEPVEVPLAVSGLLQPVGKDGGPGMHRRVDVAKVPLVGRELSVGMQIVGLEHQVQLLLAELFVYQGQGQDVEGQVPGSVPGVFPLVRHRDHVGIVHVVPVVVTRRGLARRLEGVRAAFLQPPIHIVVVELLAP